MDYRFAHALFRQTLYEGMIAPRRMRLHQQVGKALEEMNQAHLDDVVTELAEHFFQSPDPADLEKAVHYSETASRAAMEVYAYGEAVRLLDRAINLQRSLKPSNGGRACDLLLGLCDALLGVVDTRRVLEEAAPAAFSLAETMGNESGAFRASIAALEAIRTERAAPGFATPEAAAWAERAARYARPQSAQRALADAYLGHVYWQSARVRQGTELLARSLDLARRLGDWNTISHSAWMTLVDRTAPQYIEDNRKLADELFAGPRAGPSYQVALTLYFVGNTFLFAGQIHRAEQAWAELRALAGRTGQVRAQLASSRADAEMAVMHGKFQEARSLTENMRIRGEEAGILGFARVFASAAEIRGSIYLGMLLDDLELLVSSAGEYYRGAWRYLGFAHLGLKERAAAIIEKSIVPRPGMDEPEDQRGTVVYALCLEASVLLGDRPAAEMLSGRLRHAGRSMAGLTRIYRHLGGAAALLGRYEESRRHYREAIRICTGAAFRPELALSCLQLAELLLEHYPAEKKEALEHLDFAIKEFRELKMQPGLQRALRDKSSFKL